MRFVSIKACGLGPFSREVSVNLAAIEGRIVAVTGDNGAGKSTLLELLAAGLFRSTPTRGSLSELATSRDAFVEVQAVNGAAYTFRHTVDNQSGKGESVVIDASGCSVLPSAKVREFDNWARDHLPSQEVLFSSTFMAQGSGGFLEMKEGERKSVLLRTLGIERLERLAQNARDHYRECKLRLDAILARIADEEARGASVDEAEAEVAAARQSVSHAELELEKARAELARVQAELRKVEAARRDADAVRLERVRVGQALQSAKAKWMVAHEQLDGTRGMIEKETSIRAAVERVKQLDEAIADRSRDASLAKQRAEALEREGASHDLAGKAAMARVVEAERKLSELKTRAADITNKIANNRNVLGQAQEIRSAAARDAELRATQAKLQRDEEKARQDAAEGQREGAEQRARVDAATKRYDTACARERAARARLQDKAAVEQAAESLPSLRERLELERSAVANARGTLESLRNQRVAGAEERVHGLRDALGYIAAGADVWEASPDIVAAGALEADDNTVLRSQELPNELREWEAAVAACVKQEREAHDALRRADALAARFGEMDQAETELLAIETDKRDALNNIEAAKAKADEADARAEQGRIAAQDLGIEAEKVEAELASLASKVKLVDRLTQAEARIAELEPQLETIRSDERALVDGAIPDAAAAHDQARAGSQCARAKAAEHREAAQQLLAELGDLRQDLAAQQEIARALDSLVAAKAVVEQLSGQERQLEGEARTLELELAATPEPAALPPVPHVAGAETDVQTWEGEARKAYSSLAVAESRLASAVERQTRLATLVAEREAQQEELSDWDRLAQDLGRDGLQAAEIDCAGPELTELINDLLRTCVGSRWTVSVETTRVSADGKRQIEGCEVRVLDTERGRDATAESLSGGERVIVGESISLALSMLATRRSGVQGATIVRDESGAALDPTAARAYVAMLRRAADLVGASRVLFVSHNPETWELADSKIVVHDGTVEVQ